MREATRFAPRVWAPFGLALAGLACMSPACGGDDTGPAADAAPDGSDADPAEQPGDSVERSFDLGPGERIEARIAAGPGDRIHTRLGAPSPSIEWSLHAHDGDETIVFGEGEGLSEVDHQFEPDAERDYYVLFANGGDEVIEVAVRLDLFGAAELVEWYE